MTLARIAYYAGREVLPPHAEQMTIAHYIRRLFGHEPQWVTDLLGPHSNTRSLA